MPTDPAQPAIALFLFAHQDDEFGVFQQLLNEKEAGHAVRCAYLTDGGPERGLSATRNAESLAVLAELGIADDAVLFAGKHLGIGDRLLPEHMQRVALWLHAWLDQHPALGTLYVPAWEGGHPDHDALHAVAVTVADALGLLDRVRQFPLYNRQRCRGPFFRVLTPLAENGAVQRGGIPLRRRLWFLRLCLGYPSQRASWLGLFPCVLLHYLMQGTQSLQAVSMARLRQRPHAGTLYYEQRGFFSWHAMTAALARWQQAADGSSCR